MSLLWSEFNWNPFQKNYTVSSETLDNLIKNCDVKIANCSVSGKTNINGNLDCFNSDLSSLKVNGHCSFERVSVFGTSLINGNFVAIQTVFHREIMTSASEILLKDSNIKNIILKTSNSDGKPSILILKNNSIVEGDIIFENQTGIVKISADSKVLGDIVGGNVIKE